MKEIKVRLNIPEKLKYYPVTGDYFVIDGTNLEALEDKVFQCIEDTEGQRYLQHESYTGRVYMYELELNTIRWVNNTENFVQVVPTGVSTDGHLIFKRV